LSWYPVKGVRRVMSKAEAIITPTAVSQHVLCAKCGLDKGCTSPYMQPDGTADSSCDILVVGEAPGADEDGVGVPFVGKSGQLLRSVMDDLGLLNYNYTFTNVLHCRPPNNAKPTVAQIKYCLPLLKKELEQLQPQVVVILGNTPLKALLGESGITGWRGTHLELDDVTYAPTYHPAYILRNSSMAATWIEDLDKVGDLLGGSPRDSHLTGYNITRVDGLMGMTCVMDAILQADIIAIDTESNLGVNPYEQGTRPFIVSVAMGNPFKRAWSIDVNNATHNLLQVLFTSNVPKVLHNAKYDDLVVYAHWGVDIDNIVGDSMLLSHILNPVRGRHGLKQLAGRHLGMYEYDRKLTSYMAEHKEADPSKGGDFSLIPADVVHQYAALDAIATLELHNVLYEELDKLGLAMVSLYEQLIIPASAALGHMERSGVALDQRVIRRYIKLYRLIRDEQLDYILSDPNVVAYCTERNNVLNAEYATKLRAGRRVKPPKPFTFNPNSSYHMRDVLFGKDYLNLKPTARTATGKASTGWVAIKCYMEDVEFLQHYHYCKLLGKMLNTYLVPASGDWVDVDGKVRSTYLLHGTETGRLSSRHPNLQNIPTPEKEPGTILARFPVKNIFTYSFGRDNGSEQGCLMAVDYSGMELRTMTSVSGCDGMARAFEEGKDVHSVVTCALFHYEYDKFIVRKNAGDADAIAHRYRAKWVNWTLLYGGSAFTLVKLYGIEKSEATKLVNLYYGMFPEVLDYRKNMLAFARLHGYVESKFGRRRYVPYINDRDKSMRAEAERAAINMPIQSAASDVLLCSLVVIDKMMQDYSFKSKLVNTVHDSIMFDVFPGELDHLCLMVKDVMENITTDYGSEYFPDLDFTWFTCPLVADFEVGTHYGSLGHYHFKGV